MKKIYKAELRDGSSIEIDDARLEKMIQHCDNAFKKIDSLWVLPVLRELRDFRAADSAAVGKSTTDIVGSKLCVLCRKDGADSGTDERPMHAGCEGLPSVYRRRRTADGWEIEGPNRMAIFFLDEPTAVVVELALNGAYRLGHTYGRTASQ